MDSKLVGDWKLQQVGSRVDILQQSTGPGKPCWVLKGSWQAQSDGMASLGMRLIKTDQDVQDVLFYTQQGQ